MSTQLRSWFGAFAVIIVLIAALGWWVFQVTRPAAIVAKSPVTNTQSPLASPVIEALKNRTINGAIPVADPGPSHRANPFVK